MKIIFSGVQSTGKSSVIKELKKQKLFTNFVFCDEVIRNLAKQGILINDNADDKSQILIMEKHLVNLILYDNVICDRNVLDGFVYTRHLFINNKIDWETYIYCYKIFEKMIKKSDIIFYIRPEFDLVDDGYRSTNLIYRDEILELFEDTIYSLHIPVISLSGTVEERVKKVIYTVEEYIHD